MIADQLQETPDRFLRWIAKTLGVHHTTVGSVRAEMSATGELSQLDRTLGADGKSRPAKYGFRGAAQYAADPRPSAIHTPPGVCRFLHDLISAHYQIQTILDPCSGAGALPIVTRTRTATLLENS